MNVDKPKIMVLGATGQVGGLICEHLKNNDAISLTVTSRKREQLASLSQTYGKAVYLDLDDPRTFTDAMQGIDRLFLVTGYTVDMLVQSKAIVDAAKKAGVRHIVHLGVFSPEFDCYDAHFAWHQLVEAYIKISGIPYTFLHPNCFMQNFTGMYSMAKNGQVTFYAADKKVGWIALEDVAEAAAKILVEGPIQHAAKDYWFSTDLLNIHEVANIFSQVTQKPFVANALAPEEFSKTYKSSDGFLDPYFRGVEDCCTQIVDGRMAYIGSVKDDLPTLIGRKGLTLKQWAELHKKELEALA